MKNYITALICGISLSFSLPLFSQCLWRETVINFDKEEENKKSFLGVISYKDAEYTDLVFVKKKQKEEVVYETIRLDKELYTVEKFEEVEKDFGRDYFKGESYKTTIPEITTDMLGLSLVLESYEYRFKWDWIAGDYHVASRIRKKQSAVKIPPSAGTGNGSFIYLTHHIDPYKEEILVIGRNSIPKAERADPKHRLLIHRYNSELELISSSSLELVSPHISIFSERSYLDGDKFLMVLAPDSPNKSSASSSPLQYKLVIINEKGEPERVIDFFTSCHRWKINGIKVVEDEIIVYGLGEELVDKLAANAGKGIKPYSGGWWEFMEPAAYIQITTLKKDGTEVKNQTVPVADFQRVAQSIDKSPVSNLILNGKFDLIGLQKSKNGRIFLSGTAYVPRFYPRTYSDYFIVNIDSTGNLNQLFCMKNPERGFGVLKTSKTILGESYIYESPNDPDRLLWSLRYADKTGIGLGANSLMFQVKYTPVMYEIDAGSGAYKECTDRMENGFYLLGGFVNQDNIALPHVELSTPGEWLLLGNKNQNSLWVGKLVR